MYFLRETLHVSFFSYFVCSWWPTTMWALLCNNNEDDFFMMFLLFSCQLPLLAFIFLEAKLKDFLSSAELQRRDHHIRWCALPDANQSPWQKLYHSRNEQSFITFTGFDYASFNYLLSKFQPLHGRYSVLSQSDSFRASGIQSLKRRPWCPVNSLWNGELSFSRPGKIALPCNSLSPSALWTI